MANNLNVFFIVAAAAVLALGLPASLYIVSAFVRPKRGLPIGASLSPNDKTKLGLRLNSRFFLATSSALSLLCLSLLVIPVAVTLQETETHDVILKALIAVLSVAVIAGLGLFYAERKGDLNWMKTFK